MFTYRDHERLDDLKKKEWRKIYYLQQEKRAPQLFQKWCPPGTKEA
jgi:hypothetical protein